MAFVSYHTFDRDLMSPAFVGCVFLLGAVLLGFFQYDYWRLYEFGFQTAGLLLLGMGAFVVGCWVANLLRKAKPANSASGSDEADNAQSQPHSRIAVSDLSIIVVLLVSLATLAYMYYTFRTNTVAGTLNEMIAGYKDYRISGEADLPAVLNIMDKCNGIFAFLCLFVFIHNANVKNVLVRDVLLLVVPLSYCICSLLQSNRGNLLMLIIGCLAFFWIDFNRIRSWRFFSRKRIIRNLILIFAGVLTVFWLLSFATHVVQTAYKVDLIDYICAYYSGPLAAFDVYLKQGGLSCHWFGEESFVTLNNNLATLFGLDIASDRYLEFRSTGFYSVPNIYSGFRRFYHDFGILGVAFLPFVQGFVTSSVYEAVKRKRCSGMVDFAAVFYCYFFYSVLYLVIDDLFFSSLLSLSGLFRVVLLFVLYKLFFFGSNFGEEPSVASRRFARQSHYYGSRGFPC